MKMGKKFFLPIEPCSISASVYGVFLPGKPHVRMVMFATRGMEIRHALLLDTVFDKSDRLVRNVILVIETVDRMLAVRAHDRPDRHFDPDQHGDGDVVLVSTLRTLNVNALDERPGNEIAHDNTSC